MAERTQFGLVLEGSFAAAHRDALEHVLAGADTYRKRFTYHRDRSDWADSLLGERDADSARDVVIVVDREEPVGMLELVYDGGGTLTIALLVVSERARGRGVGRRAVEALTRSIAAARHDPDAPLVDTLAIGVEVQNREARAFWEALGFVEISSVGSGKDRIVNLERWLHRDDEARV